MNLQRKKPQFNIYCLVLVLDVGFICKILKILFYSISPTKLKILIYEILQRGLLQKFRKMYIYILSVAD